MRYFHNYVLSMVLITALGSLFSSCAKAQGEEALFDVKAPQFVKFVSVIEDGVPLFKEADPRSPQLLAWNENIESDMADVQHRWDDEPKPGANYEPNPEQLYIFNLLPVLGEEGDFYKVGIYNNWRQIETAYVPKSSCSDIATGPITDEVLEQQAYCTCMLVKEGDKKGLFLTTNFGDEDAEIIQLGMLSGDCILEPEHPEISCVFSEDAKEIRVEVNKETNSCTVFYGPAQSHEEEGEITVRVVDVSKLTAEQIDTLYNWAKSSLGTHVRACYYFPSYHAFDSSFQLQPFFYPNK